MSRRKNLKKLLKERNYDQSHLLLDRNKILTRLLVGLTYPITGNLSRKVQEHLEYKLLFIYSRECLEKNDVKRSYAGYLGYWDIGDNSGFFVNGDSAYNGLIATTLSTLTNLGLVGYLLSKAPEFYQTDLEPINYLTFSYAPILFFESGIRIMNLFRRKVFKYFSDGDLLSGAPLGLGYHTIEEPAPTGSLVGKLISLPFELYLKHKEKKNVKN